MKAAAELTRVSPNFAIWQAKDRAIKAELFSTAVCTGDGLVIVDPIPLAADARAHLAQLGNIAAVLVTNANHLRAASEFAEPRAISIPLALRNELPAAQFLSDGTRRHDLEAIELDGAVPGEFAFYDERDGGSVIIGDALINFEPHGFTVLPAKYCTDPPRLLRSLEWLAARPFVRLFFAHGAPIVSRARERLAALVAEHGRS